MADEPDRPLGCQRTSRGWRAFVRVQGRLYSHRFPADAAPEDMATWRDRTRQLVELGIPLETLGGSTFKEDASRYLKAVAAMPTIKERTAHIKLWVAEFGQRHRESVTAADIRAVLSRWRKTLSPATCNKRRTALMHLYAVLDGRAKPNPVRDAPRFSVPSPQPRGTSYAIIAKILAAMSPSRTRARLKVIAWTGIPMAEMMRLKPEHLHLDEPAPWVWIPGRQKGKGTEARTLPLTAEGVAAFKEFITSDAWGRFTSGGMSFLFRVACKKAGVEALGLRPYDLRHSFGSALLSASGSLKAVQDALGHCSPQLTARYTLGAAPAHLASAMAAFGRLTGGRKRYHRVSGCAKTRGSRQKPARR